MVNLKKYAIMGSRDKQIFMDLTYNDDCSGLVVFCHGYKGYKDWGAWNQVAQYFVTHGLAFLKFNFSYNGCKPDDLIDFPDLEAFGSNNYSTELNDLEKVTAFIEDDELLSKLAFQFKGLIGHSRGGGIAVLAASHYRYIDGLATWAGVSDFKSRFPSDETLDNWKNKGVYHVLNARTKQQMPHYYQFYEDFVKNEARLDIGEAAKKMLVPWLIIHGDSDEAVNIDEAEYLESIGKNAELSVIEKATHTFNTKHPWDRNELPEAMKNVCKETIEFFSQINNHQT